MSSNWCSLSMNSSQQSPLDTWSLIKWCLISMCLVLECMTGLLVRLIALVLHISKQCDQDILQSLQVVASSKDFEHNNFLQLCIQPQHFKVRHKLAFWNSKTLESFQVYDMSHLYFSYLICILKNQNLKNLLSLRRYLWDTTNLHWLYP